MDDVEKEKIKLENVTPPGMKMPVKETEKPKKDPFTINITVSDDAVKVDSSHPDIGSKNLPL
jgi:hypothetical protein